MRLLKRIVGEEHAFLDEESLNAYSYDCSPIKMKPSIVLMPENIEQLRRILLNANQNKISIAIRGNGSSSRGGCLSKGIIIAMTRFSRITKLSTKEDFVEVQAGVSINDLNNVLKKYGYEFPLKPFNKKITVGSALAVNLVTEESHFHGRIIDNVLEIEYIDATGKHGYYKNEDLQKMIGKEGSTGIIISAKLKLQKISDEVTLDILPFDSFEELMDKAKIINKRDDVLMLDYLNELSSELVDLKKQHHLIVVYKSDKGSYKDKNRINEILQVRKNLHKVLWDNNFRFINDSFIPENNLLNYFNIINELELPFFGHFKKGIIFTAFKNFEDFKEKHNSSDVVNLDGSNQGSSGYGLIKKLDKKYKSELIMLKEKFDYNNLLNKEVLL